MSDDTSASPRPTTEGPGPSFAVPAPAPAAYGQPSAAPGPVQPDAAPATDHVWTPDGLVAVPALPPERVGRGAAFALLAVPAGALVAAVVGALGFVATLSGLVTAVLAAVLYARGSGGRVKKGVPVVVGVIALGIAASFFSVVAVELWQAFPGLDPELAATYPSRGSFVRTNLFYGPVLGEAAKSLVMLVVFGLIGGVGTIVRLVRASHRG